MTRLPRRASGFTLVEILVAVSVTLIALAAVPLTHRLTTRLTTDARDETAAVGLAQAKLEELLMDPRDGGGTDTLVIDPVRFDRQWEVVQEGSDRSIRHIAVRVAWGGGRAVVLESVAWQP